MRLQAMDFSTDTAILLFSVLLIVGVVTTKFSGRIGMPSLIFFIVVGMVLNKFIYYDNVSLTQVFGVLALIVILFEGGLQTKWKSVKKVLLPSLSLATVGVLLTTLIIGFFAKLILGVTWLESLLFGAIVGSTDAAAVFSVLGNKNINRRLSSTLEAESGTNDPMAVFLTVTLIGLIQTSNYDFFWLSFNFVWQMGFGIFMGLIVGKLSVWINNKINLDSSGLYPVLALALAIFTYSLTSLANASGLLAVYILAVIMGNSDLAYRHSIFRFNEGFAWMMQILMFILLGLLVFPDQLLQVFGKGILLSLLLIFVARPVGVFLSTIFMGFSKKERLLISWAGLRGAVPIVLATFPLMAGLDNSQLFFNVVFFVVLTSALIQGSTISPVANWLGLSEGKKEVVAHSLELISIHKTSKEIAEIHVDKGSPAIGKELRKLNLPLDTLITAIIRGDRIITPRGTTVIAEGDILCILLPTANRNSVKKIILAED